MDGNGPSVRPIEDDEWEMRIVRQAIYYDGLAIRWEYELERAQEMASRARTRLEHFRKTRERV